MSVKHKNMFYHLIPIFLPFKSVFLILADRLHLNPPTSTPPHPTETALGHTGTAAVDDWLFPLPLGSTHVPPLRDSRNRFQGERELFASSFWTR